MEREVKLWQWGDKDGVEGERFTLYSLKIMLEVYRILPDVVTFNRTVWLAFKNKRRPNITVEEAAKYLHKAAKGQIELSRLQDLLGDSLSVPTEPEWRLVAAALKIDEKVMDNAVNHPEHPDMRMKEAVQVGNVWNPHRLPRYYSLRVKRPSS